MSRFAGLVLSVLLGCTQLAHSNVEAESARRRIASLGITPETLALVGCGPSEARAVATRTRENGAALETWETEESDLAQLSRELRPLLEAARSKPFDQDARAAYTTKRRELASARLRLAAARDAVFETVTIGFNADQITVLRRCGARMHTGTPPEFWVVDCSAAEWRKVQLALTAERRAERRGDAVPAEHADVLAAVREQTQVREAARLLEMNCATLRQALDDGLRADP